MAQYTDILGNKHFSEDKVICVPIDRYNELIIKEHEYDKQNKVKCDTFDNLTIEELNVYQSGYNKALEDFRKKANDFLNESSDFADFVITDTAIDCICDELRK